MLPERLTWNEGEKVCEEQQGGHLAHVESAKHLDWLRKLAKHEPFWIGKLFNYGLYERISFPHLGVGVGNCGWAVGRGGREEG